MENMFHLMVVLPIIGNVSAVLSAFADAVFAAQ
jgi:hypothetical protein